MDMNEGQRECANVIGKVKRTDSRQGSSKICTNKFLSRFGGFFIAIFHLLSLYMRKRGNRAIVGAQTSH
jgi:hypothetical protein